jgi:nicotinate-nucleotide--dimethylbenzimidazole phosphoribosyltransferase
MLAAVERYLAALECRSAALSSGASPCPSLAANFRVHRDSIMAAASMSVPGARSITVQEPDAFAAALWRKIDGKTKPLGALGRIEDLAARIGAAQGSLEPRMRSCQLTIFAGDHGLAAEGVSAYPQAVTRQMLLNFLDGNAAANVFARSVGAALRVVDAGVAGEPVAHPGLLSRRIAAGTRNARLEPAMSAAERDMALEAGRALGGDGDWDAVCFGEMGIGNTSAAALLAHKIAGLPLERLVGRGTGLDDDSLARKRAVLAAAAARTAPRPPVDAALAEYGGFEIAMMAGAMLGAAAAGRVVIVDGFIAGAAALVATAMQPAAARFLVFAHRSAEQGHAAVLAHLGAEPLLDLDMRLGEGTGALLAWPLVRAAAAMLAEMSSFESAGVSGPA